jgi:hypothetical protein
MERLSAEKRAELGGFWHSHHEDWKNSPLNQLKYCELHRMPLSRFGNWRDQFKVEDEVRQAGLLYRRGRLLAVRWHSPSERRKPQRNCLTGYRLLGGDPHPPPQICVPVVQDGDAGPFGRAHDRGRARNTCPALSRSYQQILRPSATLPPITDVRASGHGA